MPTLQVVCPPSVIGSSKFDNAIEFNDDRIEWATAPEGMDEPICAFVFSVAGSYFDYLRLRALGISAEDARFLLPTATKTEVYTTFNLRMWMHFFKMRCDTHAQWEIRDLACQMRNLFKLHLECLLPDMATA